jgi:hypothetical protein
MYKETLECDVKGRGRGSGHSIIMMYSWLAQRMGEGGGDK